MPQSFEYDAGRRHGAFDADIQKIIARCRKMISAIDSQISSEQDWQLFQENFDRIRKKIGLPSEVSLSAFLMELK